MLDGEVAQHVADGDFGIFLNEAHVGLDDWQAVLGDQIPGEPEDAGSR